MADEKDNQATADRKLLAEMRERFTLCVDAEAEQRGDSLDDLEFLSGDQWPRRALMERTLSGRPALVVNRLDQFVQHITNSMRQNRVSARVYPVDDKSDPDTAKVIQGLVRNIEYQSSADLAYDTAAFYAVAAGFGYYEVVPEYSDAKSHDQDIRIRRIRNPFTVYLDPNCQDPTGADAEFGFKVTDYTWEDFKREFGKESSVDALDFKSIGDQEPNWLPEAGVRVVEYYYKKYRNDTLYRIQTNDGMVMDVLASEMPGGEVPEGINVVAERDTQIPTCYWIKANGLEVLERTELANPQVPLFRVIGSELDINGKTILKGIIRNLKDAQRQYNYMLTAQTESAMDQGSVVGAEGQFEGHEAEWKSRVRKNQSYLQYKEKSLNGQPVPPPTRLAPDPSLGAKTEARLMAADDLKALTGIYDSALGARSNETSGKAIFQRQQQSETANFHFEDNKTRAISASTKLIVDLIPTYYDTRRTLRIMGEDDAQRLVKVNQPWKDNGKDVLYDLTTGKYDVVCTSGPSFASKRQEGVAMMVQLLQGMPIVGQAAPDIVVKAMDFPYAQELGERLKKTLPPGLLEEDKNQQIPPQLQQALQQKDLEAKAFNAHAQQLEQKVQQLEFEKAAKVVDNEAKLQIVQLQNDIKVLTTLIAAKNQNQQQEMEMYREFWRENHRSEHAVGMEGMRQQHQSNMAERQAENAQRQQITDIQAQQGGE